MACFLRSAKKSEMTDAELQEQDNQTPPPKASKRKPVEEEPDQSKGVTEKATSSKKRGKNTEPEAEPKKGKKPKK